ncbi:MAG: ribonuclease III domain-containing protein [Lachnospiraceae bacterium]|nr:ribonuclease III [Lachnospiraceae bacterium]MDD6191751.1 ribonuclease III domain-containing protein [Lachnospiraceae bacterium]MDY4793133.1 ribonuclease III domain-containing protein [Pararoseburia sp.]
MEKSINQQIKETFGVDSVDIRTYSPLTLAYIGDGIFDLVIRTLVVGKGNTSANQLHQRTSHIVKAHSQAIMADALAEIMTPQEQDVYRRGRNAKSHTMAKNATVADYRSATGFEALMGYLYLTEQSERMMELISYAMKQCGFEP